MVFKKMFATSLATMVTIATMGSVIAHAVDPVTNSTPTPSGPAAIGDTEKIWGAGLFASEQNGEITNDYTTGVSWRIEITAPSLLEWDVAKNGNVKHRLEWNPNTGTYIETQTESYTYEVSDNAKTIEFTNKCNFKVSTSAQITNSQNVPSTITDNLFTISGSIPAMESYNSTSSCSIIPNTSAINDNWTALKSALSSESGRYYLSVIELTFSRGEFFAFDDSNGSHIPTYPYG